MVKKSWIVAGVAFCIVATIAVVINTQHIYEKLNGITGDRIDCSQMASHAEVESVLRTNRQLVTKIEQQAGQGITIGIDTKHACGGKKAGIMIFYEDNSSVDKNRVYNFVKQSLLGKFTVRLMPLTA